jgi:predicted ribosome quality control (RQC) complex YloA/Tae2 family protein
VQRTLTSFDIAVVVSELKSQLKNARIQNIYQISTKTLIFKLHLPNTPTIHLLIEAGKRLHLTSFQHTKPQRPPNFCMVLRKYLKNGFVSEISQHEFDRIAILTVKTRTGEYKLVVELFGDGNIALVDSHGLTLHALTFKRMRDRDIIRNKPFSPPPSRGKNPLRLEIKDLYELKEMQEVDIIKAITKTLSISGRYAEEILHTAKVDKTKKCETLKETDFDRIYDALCGLLAHLETAKNSPHIIVDKECSWIDVAPIPMERFRRFNQISFDTYNMAIDEFYAKTTIEKEASAISSEVEEAIAKEKRILSGQRRVLDKVKDEPDRMKRIGDIIYSHLNQLQTLTQGIWEGKRSGSNWQDIISNVKDERAQGETPAVHFDSLDTKNLVLHVSIEEKTFSINLRHSIQDNAAFYYDKAKKQERKMEGAKRAIDQTIQRIKKLEQRGETPHKKVLGPKKRRKKAWYEKFRWFYTSGDMLVIGGKDAVTNEVLVKKHLAPNDLVFHADILGAPFVALKTETQKPSQQSIQEAAQLAASHSRAWKFKFSAVDVYWVHPQQLSKTPPSGEYIQRGAFIIRGKKNYIRKIPLRLAIGINPKTTPTSVIGGPPEAVESKTTLNVEIVPGDLSSSELAKKILQNLKKKAKKEVAEKFSEVTIEMVQAFIPYGRGKMINHF